MSNRIFLECTNTFNTNINTGIQRVVRNICHNARHVGAELGLECVPVVHLAGQFYPVTFRHANRRMEDISAHIWDAYRTVTRNVLRTLRLQWLEKQLVPELGHAGIFKIAHLASHAFKNTLRYLFTRPVRMQSGDMVLLLDGCAKDNPFELLEAARARGAMVGALSYDLIPLQHPHMFHPSLVAQFTRFMDWGARNVDFFLAISKTVRDDVCGFVNSYSPTRQMAEEAFASFNLAAEFDYPTGTNRIRAEMQSFFQAGTQPPFLVVGTIEPRKNHLFVIDALDKVWQQRPHARVCIIGRTGWLCQEIIQKIKNHPRFTSHILLVTDASDHELEFCYQNSLALIFPSKAEGYGLPIVEALKHGLPVLASGIPIHREVGGEWCIYFQLGSPDELAAKMGQVLDGLASQLASPPETYPSRTWEDSCRDLLTACLRQRARQMPPPATEGNKHVPAPHLRRQTENVPVRSI